MDWKKIIDKKIKEIKKMLAPKLLSAFSLGE